MINFKSKKQIRSIIALFLTVILVASTIVIAGALDSEPDNTITWDFASQNINNDAGNELRYASLEEYVEAGKLQPLEGLVSSSAEGSQFVFNGNNYPGLMVRVTGHFIAQVAYDSPITVTVALETDSNDMRPVIKAAPTPNGPWVTVPMTYNQSYERGADNKYPAGVFTISTDGIGAENCYVKYSLPSEAQESLHTWTWHRHRLQTFTFERFDETLKPSNLVNWDFSPYTSWKQNANLSSIVDAADFPGLVSGGVDSAGQTWITDVGYLHVVGTGRIIIKMAENSPFTAEFYDNGSGLKPTVKVSNSPDGPWVDVTPAYTNDGGVNKLELDGIGEGNCYLMYIISGTNWGSYWNHKLSTITFEKWIAPPVSDDKVNWDFTQYANTSGQNLSAMTGGTLEGMVNSYCDANGQWRLEGSLQTVISSTIIIKMAKNSPFDAEFIDSGSGLRPTVKVSDSLNGTWTTVTPTYTKNGNRILLSLDGIGENNCYLQYTISGTGWGNYWNHKLYTVTFNRFDAGSDGDGAELPACDTKVVFDRAKDSTYWDFRECYKVTSNMFFAGTQGGVFPNTMPYEGGQPTVAMRVGKNSPVVVCYSQKDTKIPKFYVSGDGTNWNEILPDTTTINSEGQKCAVFNAIGKENMFFQFEFPQDNNDMLAGKGWIVALESISYNLAGGVPNSDSSDDNGDLPNGMKKINFVSPKWNQSYDLTKYPEIIGFNGVFVSDKPGYMRMDIDWSTFKINTDNNSNLEFVMAENSSVVLNVTTHGANLEDRPKFYVSANRKKWTEIKPNKVENLGADSKIGAGDYIIQYTFDAIGKNNIFFKFEFGVQKGEAYTLIGLRDITFAKNTTYTLPEEPILDSVIIFDAQKDAAYYDFRACEEVTDNMFWGGGTRGVFPCTMTTTGHQPGVIIKVAKNSPISVRYKDIGLGKKPIYSVSSDKINWTIIESDWSDKDTAGDTVDVFNAVGKDNIYFRFEFPQTQKEFSASQGWLLTLQSICYNEFVKEETESEPVDTPVEEENLLEIIESLRDDETNEEPDTNNDKNNTVLYTVIIIIASVIVLAGASAVVLILVIKKRKK